MAGAERLDLIRGRLEVALSPSRLEIVDESHKHTGHAGAQAGGGHFMVTIVSEQFSGCTPIERHRLVYRALAGLMPSEIHALGIKASAPGE